MNSSYETQTWLRQNANIFGNRKETWETNAKLHQQVAYKGAPSFHSRLWKTVLQEQNLKCDEGDGFFIPPVFFIFRSLMPRFSSFNTLTDWQWKKIHSFLWLLRKGLVSLNFTWPALPSDASHQNILQFLMSESSQQHLKGHITTGQSANGA